MNRLLKWSALLLLLLVALAAIVRLVLTRRAEAPEFEPEPWSPPPFPPPAPQPASAQVSPVSEMPEEALPPLADDIEAAPEALAPEEEIETSEAIAEPLESPSNAPGPGRPGRPGALAPSDQPEASAEAVELVREILDTPEPKPSPEPPSAPVEGMETESGVALPDEVLAMDRDDGMPAPLEMTAEPMGSLVPTGTAPVAERAPEARDDVLTEAFAQLAAMPADSTSSEPPAADETARILEESLEEALADLPPARIQRPPGRNAESYLDEGNVYFNVGQYSLAIERYGRAIELDPNLIAAYYNRANALTRAGQFEDALHDYDRAIALQPNDADALNNRGMLHLYRTNYAAALHDFDAALAIDPADTTVMVNRGLANLHAGGVEGALSDFREAAAIDPQDPAAQYGAAQALAALGDRAQALVHIERALRIDPGYAREAAADPRLSLLQGDDAFMRLLRDAGSRSG